MDRVGRDSGTSFVLLIPYFNESHRLDVNAISDFLSEINCDVIFVDDGSSDSSATLVDRLCFVLNGLKINARNYNLSTNQGKARALIAGMSFAKDCGYTHAINLDIDLPLSIKDVQTGMTLTAEDPNLGLVSGARVRLAGSGVKRTIARQWIGRIIATYIYFLGKIEMYDTQSPLKIYNLEICKLLENHRFRTRWFGDVEIILGNQLYFRKAGIREFPLDNWVDISQGYFTVRNYHEVFFDLLKLTQVLVFRKTTTTLSDQNGFRI
jgi:glycosyltransferase involved in cell wall biosynthesis